MTRDIIRIVAKLTVLSVIVGLIMSHLRLKPGEVFTEAGDIARTAARSVVGALGWAWEYFILGATVVVPVWLVVFLWQRRKG